MTTDPVNEYLAAARYATVQTAAGAEALQAAVHHRWSVKTGADAGAGQLTGQVPTVTTIASLRALAVPAVLPPDGRSEGAEQTVWQLDATLTGYKREADGDYHLVIADDQGNTMIAEIPDPAALAPGSFFVTEITGARQAFDDKFGLQMAAPPAAVPAGAVSPEVAAAPEFGMAAAVPALIPADAPVTVRGLGFFDFAHGQDGVAPNAIELHPVISIEFGAQAPASPA
jgi:hypothetical protein